MARLSLQSSMKFKRLVKRLKLPRPYVYGLLEIMWDTCHSKGDSLIGDGEAVEIAAEWPGDDGAFFEALRDGGWIEQVGDQWQCHDYWNHAPDYVVKRASDSMNMTRGEARLAMIHADKVRAGVESPTKSVKSRTDGDKPRGIPAECIPAERSSPPTPSPGAFDRFWEAYPNKTAPVNARKAWDFIGTLDLMIEPILEAIEKQKRSPKWQRDSGRFIPAPAKWLRGGCWNDKPLDPEARAAEKRAARVVEPPPGEEEQEKAREKLRIFRRKGQQA